MIKHSNGYIEEYLKEIESNKIIAGNEILQILHNLISDMKSDNFVYDTTDADRRMSFIEGCLRLTKSPFYQKPFKLMLWQKAFISALYGFYMSDDGTQRFRKACLLIARKNGKAVDINTIIDTPSGRKLFKDIHEGDYVFGYDGKPVKVLWESDIRYDDTYKVIFEDGEEIIAGASHNWSVTTDKNADFESCIVKTTEELVNTFNKGWRVPLMTTLVTPDCSTKAIIDITPVETVPSKCIAVDDKYHLFAVGERNTLTHNSELCSALLLTDFFIGGKGMDIVCSSNDDTQASILFDACDTMRQLIDPMSEDTWRNQKGLKCFINNNKIFKISERTRNREGRNIDTSVFDECFPPDVEILTQRGFIRFDELKDSDLVAEVNDDTFDFVKPVRMIKRKHEGELIGTTIGSNAKLFTTPNHNMVYMNTKTNEYEFVKAIDVPEKHHKLVKYNEKANAFEYIDSSTQKECVPYSGDVYCVEVPTHKIIVKSDGIPVVCGNCHELQSGDIIKAIEQSQSLKPNPKFICITTEGFVNGGWLDQELIRARGILFNEIHDEASIRYLPWLYTQDSEAEIWQGNKTNRLWMKSNPSLGTVKRYDYLEQQIALARGNGTDRAFVLSKDFNVKQSNSEAWLLSEDIEYDAEFDPEEFRGSICLGAVDIAETTDLTCAKILLMKPDDSKKYIFSQYWIPQGKIDRGDLDIKAGARYLDWQKHGIIRICDGNYIDTTVIADWFYELYKTYGFRLYKCGYDVKFSTDFVKRMGDYGFDSELVYQSPTVMSQPMKMVEADIKDKLIVGNTEIDKWCFSNVSLQINAQGQGMAVKIDNMSSRKIDGAVTTIILYEIYRRYRLDFTNALEN